MAEIRKKQDNDEETQRSGKDKVSIRQEGEELYRMLRNMTSRM